MKYGFTYQPMDYLNWYTIEKIKGLYLGPYYWRTVFDIPLALVYTTHVVAMAIGSIGLLFMLISAIRKRNIPYMLLLFTLAYFTVIYVPFVAFSRYGYPNLFLIFIAGAFFVDRLISNLKHNRLEAIAKP